MTTTPTGLDVARTLREGEPFARAEVTSEYLEHHGVLPVLIDGHPIVVTWRAHPDAQVLDDLRLMVGGEVSVVTAEESEVRGAIQRLYAADGMTAEEVIAGLQDEVRVGSTEDTRLDDLVHLANEAPVVKLVNLILLEALEARASDVHLEGHDGGLRVRNRIDGVLQDGAAPPRHLGAAVVSRLKIMADLDIAERRVPQDGRIRLNLRDRRVDVRVSTLPTLHGESVVLRLLDKDRGRIDLGQLGMAPDTRDAFEQVVSKPHGIVLATGPTGSGKTTTLYAAVDFVRTGREKIITVEDPVEYELEGVPQVPVREKVGLTFASALRAMLRQDPDIMLIGEIRDHETADIATHASLTGHLVLSTLHTNDAPTALTRLVDLGVEAYLVASTVEGVLAQRLVRRICSECIREHRPDDDQLRLLGATRQEVGTPRAGAGCEACRDTGYLGRTGIYEMMVLDDALRAAVHDGAGAGRIMTMARDRGMRLLREDGLRLVRDGVTTVEEVLRVANA